MSEQKLDVLPAFRCPYCKGFFPVRDAVLACRDRCFDLMEKAYAKRDDIIQCLSETRENNTRLPKNRYRVLKLQVMITKGSRWVAYHCQLIGGEQTRVISDRDVIKMLRKNFQSTSESIIGGEK